MSAKIAAALARVLDPIKPIARPGQSISLTKSPEGTGGGHGSGGYDSPEKKKSPAPSAPPETAASLKSDPFTDEDVSPEQAEKRNSGLPFQPGLTQVILDLNSARVERSAGAAAQTYETGAKEQKKNARLPKGSMLDKKIG